MLKKLIAGRKKTVFLHVMKTGGMTFRGILSSIYGDGFHVCEDPALSSVKAQLAKYDCVEFHMMPHQNDWVNLHAEVAAENRWDLLEGMNIFTMFREPVEQIISLYYFMLKIRKDIEPLMKASGVVFPETIDEFLNYRENYNNQTAFLVGKSQHGGRFVGSDDLAEAQKIVRRLGIHVGLTERFDDSLRVFQKVTGCKLPSASGIIIENRNQMRPPMKAISSKVKDRIREESVLDLELYAFARERFVEDFFLYVQPARRFSFPGLRTPAALQAQFESLNLN
jgi:hypothetical protein